MKRIDAKAVASPKADKAVALSKPRPRSSQIGVIPMFGYDKKTVMGALLFNSTKFNRNKKENNAEK